MNLQQLKDAAKSYFLRTTDIVKDVPDRTKGWRGDLEDQGIIPNRVGVDREGRIIPPFFVWWAPWMFRVVLVIAGFIIGGVLESINSGPYPDTAMLIPFAMGFAMWFLRNQTSWIPGLIITVLAVTAASLMSKSVLISLEALILFALVVLVEYIYARAAFDYNTAAAFEEMKQALSTYGTAYELEEREDTNVNGETLTTVSALDSGRPARAMIRLLPEHVDPGWLIAVDPARRFMTGLSPEQRVRISEIQEQM